MTNVVMKLYTPAFNLHLNYTSVTPNSSSFFWGFYVLQRVNFLLFIHDFLPGHSQSLPQQGLALCFGFRVLPI